MLGVFESRALNCYTFFHSIPLILYVSKNLVLTHLPLSESLDSLLCDLIAPTPGLAFSLVVTHASGSIIIFVRQGVSFSKLSTSSLSLLDPYSDYVGINLSLNNSSSPSFFNVYAPPIHSSLTDGRTNSSSPSILPSYTILFILGDCNYHHPFWDSKGTSDPHGEEVFDWVISSDLLPLNDSDIPTLLHCSSWQPLLP